MFEEEIRLLKGTSDKLKLRESTELAHDFEDPCDNLSCSLSKSPEKLKEQIVVLDNSKPTVFSEQRKLNNSSFVGYHFGITPTFFVNADHLEIKITPGACGPLHRKEICPKVRNSEPCDIIGTMEMFWIDMYFPFTNHSFEHPLALRMMCGYEVSEKLAFVITKWSGEFVSMDKEILATWKGIKCFKFLGALAMVYIKQEDDVYYEQQRMIEFGLIGPEGHTLIFDGILVNFLVGIVVHGFNHPTNQRSRFY
nr:dihydropyrimidinase [Quercus suber]